MNRINNISFIGSGNVATHLGIAFHNKGIKIEQVYSRQLNNAQLLATKVSAQPVTNLQEIHACDCIIVSVPDDHILEVFQQIKLVDSLLVHTSGITDIIKTERDRSGYIYPLDSFRKEVAKNVSKTPFFVAAVKSEDEELLVQLAELISNCVKNVSAEDKKRLHLSAVFVNNYVNHLFGLTFEFLQENNLKFDYLLPIIENTIENSISQNPLQIQTGPAIRNDEITKQKHEQLMNEFPELKKVYQLLWDSIQRKHNV